MPDPLHNLNELMAELEGSAIKTTQGSFIKVEDVRKLLEKRKVAREEEGEQPKPKTMLEAREASKRYLKEQGIGPKGPQEPGRAVPAGEYPTPLSRA